MYRYRTMVDTFYNRRAFYAAAVMFFVSAGCGWVAECVYFMLRFGLYVNRGYCFLCFLPIYGFGVLLVYLILGTPARPRFFARRPPAGSRMRRVVARGLHTLCYFVAAVALITALEFSAGWALDRLLHISLWDYSSYRGNVLGYVAPAPSLLWGVLITLYMPFLEGQVGRIFDFYSYSVTVMAVRALSAVLLADFAFHTLLRLPIGR